MRARELMSAPVLTVRPETPIKEVAEQMAARGVSGVPVIDRSDHLVGMLSESDFLASIEYGSRATGFPGLLDCLAGLVHATPRRTARTASDLMRRQVVTAGPDTTLRELTHLMIVHDVNRLPIVDAGRVVGIVARADIVRALARHDEAITEEVRWRLQHDLWIDTTDLAITTRNGMVTLAGMVESRADAVLIEHWAASTDGVIAVDTQDLRFRFDDRRIKAVGLGI